MPLHLTDFDFELPKDLIAQAPARPRDHARLLVYRRSDGTIRDDSFYNLDHYLPANTTLVLNNSRVEKCRLRFSGSTEIFVLETAGDCTVRAMVRPGRKFKLGATVQLLPEVTAKVTVVDDDGLRTLELSVPLTDQRLDAYRLTPLPPYIAQDESLADEYQTVYAHAAGSKAAPTAGLHFTSELLAAIGRSHPMAYVTLHVGLGTFAPVKTNDLTQISLHHEWYGIDAPTAEVLNRAAHITAIGTTTVRTLESAGRPFRPHSSSTDIFIGPGYRFTATDALVTNFHLPKSTLLMLVSAFIGSVDELQRVYAHAIAARYRFYSFGDAMLIL